MSLPAAACAQLYHNSHLGLSLETGLSLDCIARSPQDCRGPRSPPLCTARLVHVQVLEAVFIFCTVWSLGAAVVENSAVQDRTRFDRFLKNLAGLGESRAARHAF